MMAYEPAWKDNINNPVGEEPTSTTPLLSSNTSDSSVYYYVRSSERRTRFSFSVFNLMNAIMGSGILGLSYAVMESGIILFVILLSLVLTATIYTVNLLLEMCHMTGVMSFEDIGDAAFKNKGKILTVAVIMTQNIGSMSSYLYIIKTELPEVIESLMGIEQTDAWFSNGDYLVLLVMFTVILPLACLPKIGFLSYTSSFSVLSMSFFMIVVVVEKFRLPCPIPDITETNITSATVLPTKSMFYEQDEQNNSTCQPDYFLIGLNTAYAIPTMAFSFVCHTAVIPIYKELSNPTKQRMLGVSMTALLSCFFMYLITGVFGYLTFYEKVESELLLSYSQYPNPAPIISVVRLVVIVAIIFHLPVIHFPCRISLVTLLEMILPRRAPSRAYMWCLHVCSTLMLLTAITLIALFVPDIKQIFGFFGATSSTGLLLFLPSLFYLKIAPGAPLSKKKIIPLILLFSSFVILVVCLTAILLQLLHPLHE
ncbi:Sodium-coupled neutral amino acid transporter 2 [Holothuria leucospilota]|uniref:Sodium-coupled neutral amino acid transporter 2 n=1 Tax=Holothuria leucospilota TaxID=206669 RepID=A0A9Q1CGJ5_HOLLE|nr:Sodium-coupled neutral amino acid transporter 2 [Holothuria leucospilota]